MKKLLNFLTLICILALAVSCKDDEKPKGEFSTGVWIINEGAFGHSNSSVSSYNASTGVVQQDLFGLKNNKKALGDVAQSATINGDLAYIVINNDNKIEVVNANTFVSSYTLSDLALPRYLTVYNGKGYLTEWVNFSDSSRVSVIDLSKHTVSTSVNTGKGAENIIAVNDKLYVSNSFSNTVAVIDPAKNKLIKTIEVADSPGAFVLDSSNKLWVICGGSYEGNNGALYRIDPSTNATDSHINLGMNVTAKMVTNKAKNTLFYFAGTSVYSLSITASEAPANALVSEQNATEFYGIGFDTKNDILYVCDDNGFTANGTVFRYKSDGTVIDNFSSDGIGPNGLIFR
ncbi:MAG TPA: YncE family protein [Cyclobacteriaceae bacterium]|jgi:YVTN family beta-propeller protein|nr:YncE family protein [Cyclobacteriaceae bacterium]